jgi:hypothetical protein
MSPGAGRATVTAIHRGDATMAWNELFTSDAGLMSLAVILGILLIAGVTYWRLRAYIREESKSGR